MVSSVFVVVLFVFVVLCWCCSCCQSIAVMFSVTPTVIEALRLKSMAQRKISSAVRQQVNRQLHIVPVHTQPI